jgi:sialic acid synthase SpsE/sugar phosphate isomerase/epimerase
MIIDKNISDYIVFSEDAILNALRKISDNKSRIVFAVTESGKLDGVLTDGDFRRWIVNQKSIDLNLPVSRITNKDYVWFYQDDEHEKIRAGFSGRIEMIPLIDRHGHITAIARRQMAGIRIGDTLVDADSPTFVIAEIGNNHNGDFKLALRLVDAAVEAGANCAKFQMRHMPSLYSNAGNAQDASADLGAQYTLDLLARFQLSNEQLYRVFDYCGEQGIIPLCTPWDVESVQQLERYGMPAYKVASADLTNHDLLKTLAGTGKPLICSTGMSMEREIIDTVTLLKRLNVPYVLLHCNSTYPAPFKDVNLSYLDRLREIGDCLVGYSGHERGFAVAIAAVSRGAKVIEKHITLDRNMEGNDHRVSLLPAEFKAMVQGIREVEQAMGNAQERRISQGELMNREVLGKSLVINRDLKAGEIIDRDMIDVKSPGQGLPPYRKDDLVGKPAQRDLKKGDFFFPSDVEERKARPRPYRLDRRFGIPIRYHDIGTMAAMSNMDLLEFHLSYKDLDEEIHKYLKAPLDKDFVVHSPELFAGDHIMDLCSDDPGYRRRSLDELRRVIDITRALKPYFRMATRPLIIINAGGFTLDAPMPAAERGKYYERIAESLATLDTEGVEIIPQTMPPFPWHFGGQRYHNLFVDPADIVKFCREYGYRVCLDISHSKLACNYFKWSFKDFIDQVGPYTAHLHIVDAEGVDGEGLQIGEGDIDFLALAESLRKVAPGASFVPEVWQGHKNEGEGFWVALERLEKWFAPA